MQNLRSMAIAIALASGISLINPNQVFAQTCEVTEPIVFGDLDWDSAVFHNAVARFILEKGYGCKTDAIPGTTVPLYAGAVRGDIDIVMEIWENTSPEVWTKGVADKKVLQVGVNFPDAYQRWFVPRYLVEGDDAPAKGLKSVADLPKYKDLFKDPEEPSKGRFYNCISGWSCEIINSKKFHAYGLDKDFVNFRPGTGAALTAVIESSIKRKRPVVFHYWGPTWVLGKLGNQLVALEEPAYDDAIWQKLMAAKQPEAVSQATAYPEIAVVIGVNARFAAKAPEIMKFLQSYKTTSALVSEGLAHMQDNGGSVEKAAESFLRDHRDVWSRWVPADVAGRVASAL